MRIDIITIVPALFDNVFNESVLGSAVKNGLIEIHIHSFRKYGIGRHRVVDDTAFGGGPGMILKPEPLITCIRDVKALDKACPVIGLSPQGITLNQQIIKELYKFERLILVCGRYEGFDERIINEFDCEISLGDYVLTGGEIAAAALVDAISRMIPGTVGCQESVEQDSFYEGLLDFPQYTRPAVWQQNEVPRVLQNGNHAEITAYRRQKALLATAIKRPDLFASTHISDEDKELLQTAVNSGNI